MSVTVHPDQEPVFEQTECSFCDGTGIDALPCSECDGAGHSESYAVANIDRDAVIDCDSCLGEGHFQKACIYCFGKGYLREPVWSHEMTLSNTNAYRFFGGVLAIDIVDGFFEVKHAEIPAFIAHCMRLINSERHSRSYAVETVESYGALGAKFVEVGMDSGSVQHYAVRFLDMLKYAQQQGVGIVGC